MGAVVICLIEGCQSPKWVRGLCHAHYKKHRKAGTLDQVALPDGRRKTKKMPAWISAHASAVREEWINTPFLDLPGHIQERFWELLDALGPETCYLMYFGEPPPEQLARIDATLDNKSFSKERRKDDSNRTRSVDAVVEHDGRAENALPRLSLVVTEPRNP